MQRRSVILILILLSLTQLPMQANAVLTDEDGNKTVYVHESRTVSAAVDENLETNEGQFLIPSPSSSIASVEYTLDSITYDYVVTSIILKKVTIHVEIESAGYEYPSTSQTRVTVSIDSDNLNFVATFPNMEPIDPDRIEGDIQEIETDLKYENIENTAIVVSMTNHFQPYGITIIDVVLSFSYLVMWTPVYNQAILPTIFLCALTPILIIVYFKRIKS